MKVFILGLGGYLSIYFQFEGHLSICPFSILYDDNNDDVVYA